MADAVYGACGAGAMRHSPQHLDRFVPGASRLVRSLLGPVLLCLLSTGACAPSHTTLSSAPGSVPTLAPIATFPSASPTTRVGRGTPTPTPYSNIVSINPPVGSPATATPTPAPPSASLIVRSSTEVISPDSDQTLSAQCHAGEQLVGGGFSYPNNTVYGDYPTGNATWTVRVQDYSYFSSNHTLIAYAVCMAANFNAGMTRVSSSAVTLGQSSTVSAHCPAGGVVASGGFLISPAGFPGGSTAGSSPVIASGSTPGSSVWTAAGYGPSFVTLQAFALCATSHLTSAGALTNSFVIAPKASTTVTLTCGSGALATGSGFSNGVTSGSTPFDPLASRPDTASASEWQFTGIDEPNVTTGQGASHEGTMTLVCLGY